MGQRMRRGPGLGAVTERGPRFRECPKCPAGPNGKCVRWNTERWRESGELKEGAGRWEPMVSWHKARSTPNGADAETVALMAAERIVCDNPAVHGYHWTTVERTVWCRGRARR